MRFPLYPLFCSAMVALAQPARATGATNFPQMRVVTHHASEQTEIDNGRKVRFHVDVYYPQADGEMPVLLVVGGLNGVLPTVAYGSLLHNIASRGVIVVVPNGQMLAAERYRDRAIEVVAAADWLPQGLPRLLALRADGGTPQPLAANGLFIMGHSSGGQAVVAAYELLKQRVTGVILLDPVDGDPYNMHPRVLAPGARFPKELKALLVTTELCNQPGWKFKWFPACCPPGISAEHFYQAFTGQRWWANTLDFAHLDVLDDLFAMPVNFTGFCKASDRKHPKPKYRDFVALHVAGFMQFASWGLAFPPTLDNDYSDVRFEMRHDV